MKKKKKVLAGILAAALWLSGCTIAGKKIVITSGMSSEDVFSIGGASCSLTEAKIYLANYQNIYGKSYGIDLWEQEFQEKQLQTYVKEIALSEMTRIVCMDLLAKEREITLSKEEEAQIEKAAKTYYASLSEAELEYTDASEADIVAMYEDYVLADKVYQSLTNSVDEEVSDDEARIMEAMQIYVNSQEKVNEIEEKLANGEDFAAIASNYNEKPEIEITFGRGEMPEVVEKVAFELDNEEISDCISTEEGYYFIKCTNKYNEELTDANKSNIVEAREEAAFDDVYHKFVVNLISDLNEEVWEKLTLLTDGSITTDSFFETIKDAIH